MSANRVELYCDRNFVEGAHQINLNRGLLRFLMTVIPLRLIYMGLKALHLSVDKVPICFFHPSCKCQQHHSRKALMAATPGDGHEWLNHGQLLDHLGIRSLVRSHWKDSVPDTLMLDYKLNNFLPVLDATSTILWGVTCMPEKILDPYDALLNVVACRRYANEGIYFHTLLTLYHANCSDKEAEAMAVKSIRAKKLPKHLKLEGLDYRRLHKAARQALDLFGRHPDTGYIISLSEKWDDHEANGIGTPGEQVHRFVVLIKQMVGVLERCKSHNDTPFELMTRISGICDFHSEDAFILYQIGLSYRWYLNVCAAVRKRSTMCVLPLQRRVAGPGMIPFCRDLAPGLFRDLEDDTDNSEMPPHKRPRTTATSSRMANNATRAEKRSAVTATQYLCDTTARWSFLQQVFKVFDIHGDNFDYDELEFVECEVARLLHKPVARRSDVRANEFVRAMRQQLKKLQIEVIWPQLFKVLSERRV
jgi:hypothetical protein